MKFKEDSFIYSIAEAWKRAMRDNFDGLIKSRRSLFFTQICQMFYNNMIGNVFNTALLLLLFADATDEQYGYFLAQATAMVGLFGLASFISPFIVEKLKKRRAFVYILSLSSAFLNIVVFPLIVIAPIDVVAKGYLYIANSVTQTLLNSLCGNSYSVWTLHSLPEEIRSDYYTVINLSSSVINNVLAIILAMYMDFFQANSMAFLGIIIMRGIAIAFVTADYILRGGIVEPEYNKSKKRVGFRDILKAPFQSKKYLVIVLYSCIWMFGNGFVNVYYTTYLIDGAHLTYTFINFVGMFGMPLNLISIAVWSKFIRKKGWIRIMPAAMFLFSVAHFINGFVAEKTHWVYAVSILYCAAVSGGYTLSEQNLPYLYLPENLRDSCLMFRSLCLTIVSFLSASAANVFYKYTIGRNIVLFGITLENRAYMCLIGFGIMQIAILMLVGISIKEKHNAKLNRPI